MSKAPISHYQCLLCQKRRTIKFDAKEHEDLVYDSPNGLALYSDIHRCDEGILAINNLHIDINYDVRSFSSLELPDKRKPVSKALPGLPIARAHIPQQLNIYHITQMDLNKEFRLTIEDTRLNAVINIGRVSKREKAIAAVESDQGSVILFYYPCDIEYNTYIERWMNILVNQLELLPVTRLGLFVETVRFIHGLVRSNPDAFQAKQLQTILSSHETYFKVLVTEVEEVGKLEICKIKYNEEVRNSAERILQSLRKNTGLNLKEVAFKVDLDLIYLIYTFLIMEQEGIIEVLRPSMKEP